ncbi:biotinylated TB7.3 domain protein [Mycobacterium xenopi 3993]|nr:biotinylated TB7.3 domain protein [Mycobacterium xenopi 3993]
MERQDCANHRLSGERGDDGRGRPGGDRGQRAGSHGQRGRSNRRGDTLVLLESMKMEIPVLAEVAGTVSKVSVAVGDVIQAGDLIAVIS